MTPVLSALDLTLSYPGQGETRAVFRGLSLALQPGEVVSIVGASGVGKSSLLRVLAGLIPASSGSLRVHDSRVSGASSEVALAFQDARLLPWLSLEENVGFGLSFSRQPKLSRADRRARVLEAIASVGLADARRKLPSQLSGGMAQRAAFARCLARHPAVLLLDEPFGALDEVTRTDMQRLLLQLARVRGTSVLLSTHDLDEALRLSDRILLLGGRPARFVCEWAGTRGEPETTHALRLEIVRALADANGSSAHTRPATPSIEEGSVSCATT